MSRNSISAYRHPAAKAIARPSSTAGASAGWREARESAEEFRREQDTGKDDEHAAEADDRALLGRSDLCAPRREPAPHLVAGIGECYPHLVAVVGNLGAQAATDFL